MLIPQNKEVEIMQTIPVNSPSHLWQSAKINLANSKSPAESFETVFSGQNHRNRNNCNAGSSSAIFQKIVSATIVPMYRVNNLFLKGMEDGALSIADLEASFEALFDEFHNKLVQNKIDVPNLELMTDDNGELAVYNDLPEDEKQRICEILSKSPGFKKLFNQMQFIAKLQQHPELFDDFAEAYQENPTESLVQYNQLLAQNDKDGIFILGIQGNQYQVIFKKFTIQDIQDELEKAIWKFENILRNILSNNPLDMLSEIKLQPDGEIILTNSADKAAFEKLLDENQILFKQLNKIRFLADIVENPGTLPKYARSFLLKQY